MELSKKKSYGILIIFLLLASAIPLSYVYGALSYTTIIESGSMVTQPSYTIFKDGSTYYAKNGKTGAIDYTGSDASTVINNAISTIGRMGGIIFLKVPADSSYYLISTTLELTSRIRLIGEVTSDRAINGVYLEADCSPVIRTNAWSPETRCDNIEISNLALFDAYAPKDKVGLNLTLARYGRIDQVYLYGFDVGIYISAGGFYNMILEPHISNCATGIEITNEIASANSNTVFGGQVTLCDLGINLVGCTMNEIIDVGIESNTIGLQINGGIRHRLMLCRMENNDLAINITGGDVYQNNIKDNMFTGNTHILNGTLGVNSYVRDNSGYCTENWGSEIDAGTPVVVTHGLHSTPTYVYVTSKTANEGSIWVTDEGPTTFTINWDGGGVGEFYWYAVYEP